MLTLPTKRSSSTSKVSSYSVATNVTTVYLYLFYFQLLVGGWTNPFEKYASQIGSFPQFSGWKLNKTLKPSPTSRLFLLNCPCLSTSGRLTFAPPSHAAPDSWNASPRANVPGNPPPLDRRCSRDRSAVVDPVRKKTKVAGVGGLT